jgi:hypothetical protein
LQQQGMVAAAGRQHTAIAAQQKHNKIDRQLLSNASLIGKARAAYRGWRHLCRTQLQPLHAP